MSEIIISSNELALDLPRDDKWLKVFMVWLLEFRSLRTRDLYNEAWHRFNEHLNGVHPGAVETSDVVTFKIRLARDHSPATVNLHLSAISSFYKYVMTRHATLRDDNPAEGIRHEAVNPYGKATHLLDGQDKVLLKSVDRSTPVGMRDYAILVLFLTTGIRLDAVEKATLDSIRNQGDVMLFQYTNKGGDAKVKKLPPRAAQAIRDYLSVRNIEGNSLFGMTRRAIQHMIKRRADAVLGENHGITPHSLRHTAAMNAHRSGGTVREVKELLEHKSSRVTLTYLDHMDNVDADKMSRLLDDRYGD